ncbi:unnamed protein product [Vitrella brassicaformis CCMP3155]|uniref:Uncharacterized protein n=2 Tax=Vitrella brassicaformis TaxID=1169539 RepID=A0A0G4EBZ8_VITBC|nr:unnamed protein product [Vitrella brassicaformis CCMP3155]|eukprot:CEL93515.1 unnamed protein product [Vitrella brassicaformis CCMP3155]
MSGLGGGPTGPRPPGVPFTGPFPPYLPPPLLPVPSNPGVPMASATPYQFPVASSSQQQGAVLLGPPVVGGNSGSFSSSAAQATPVTPDGMLVLAVPSQLTAENSQIIPYDDSVSRLFPWLGRTKVKWEDIYVNWDIYAEARRALSMVWDTLVSPDVDPDDVKDPVSSFLLAEAYLISGVSKASDDDMKKAKKLYSKAHKTAKEWYQAAKSVYRDDDDQPTDDTQRKAVQVMACCSMVMGETVFAQAFMKVLKQILKIFPDEIEQLATAAADAEDAPFLAMWTTIMTVVPAVGNVLELTRQLVCAVATAINHFDNARTLLKRLKFTYMSHAAPMPMFWVPPWQMAGDPTADTAPAVEGWDGMVLDMLDGANFIEGLVNVVLRLDGLFSAMGADLPPDGQQILGRIRLGLAFVVLHIRGSQSLPSDWEYGASLLRQIRRHGSVRAHVWMAKAVSDSIMLTEMERQWARHRPPGAPPFPFPPPQTPHEGELALRYYSPPIFSKLYALGKRFGTGDTAGACTLLEAIVVSAGGFDRVLSSSPPEECEYYKPIHKVFQASMLMMPYLFNQDYTKVCQLLQGVPYVSIPELPGGCQLGAILAVNLLLSGHREEALHVRHAYMQTNDRWWRDAWGPAMMKRLGANPTPEQARFAFLEIIFRIPPLFANMLKDPAVKLTITSELLRYESMVKPVCMPSPMGPIVIHGNPYKWHLCVKMLEFIGVRFLLPGMPPPPPFPFMYGPHHMPPHSAPFPHPPLPMRPLPPPHTLGPAPPHTPGVAQGFLYPPTSHYTRQHM